MASVSSGGIRFDATVRGVRADNPAGPFTEVGEVTATPYVEPVEATQGSSMVYDRVQAANAAGAGE